MKILIIGVGSIGERHLKNLLKLGYKDIALSDFSKERIQKLKIDYHLAVYSDWHLALKETKPMVTFICTSAESHIVIAKEAIQGGSHVFIEKPLSVNLNSVDDLIHLVKQGRKTAMVACNYLFHRGFLKLQKNLEKGIYGKPLFCRVVISYYLPNARKNRNYKDIYAAKKKQGGGVIFDSGSHAVNYLENLFGEISKSSIVSSRMNSLKIQSEEVANLVLEHRSGILSTVALDYLSRKPVHQVEVVTDRGLLTLDFKNDCLVFEDDKNKKILYQGPNDSNVMFIDEVIYFLKMVKMGGKVLQDLSDGKRILRVLSVL